MDSMPEASQSAYNRYKNELSGWAKSKAATGGVVRRMYLAYDDQDSMHRYAVILALLEAMKEPTVDMVAAVDWLGPLEVRKVWRAMINNLLETSK